MDTFPYHSRDARRSPADPSATVWRPMLPIAIVGQDHATTLYSLVDTGAVETLVPYENLSDIYPNIVGDGTLEAANGTKITVFYGQVDLAIRLGDKVCRWGAIVGFSEQREEMVLGDVGFFRYFYAGFDRHRKLLTIRKNANLPEQFYQTPLPSLPRPPRDPPSIRRRLKRRG